MGKFSSKTVDAFAEGFGALLLACDASTLATADGVGGPDVIGQVYMEVLTNAKGNYLGQYFTPWPVCRFMARMIAEQDLEARFYAEIKSHLHDNPIVEAMTLTAAIMGQAEENWEAAWWWLMSKVWPLLRDRIEPVCISDPCVGSGRMLLAYASTQLLWLAQIGYIQYSGVDLDVLCVDMARLNMRLYGLSPMQVQPATIDALHTYLSAHTTRAATTPQEASHTAIVQASLDVLQAPVNEQPALAQEVTRQINRLRKEQLSLFD
jgi:hypothetical protein